MAYDNGDLRAILKPGPRTRAALGRALDIIFPPQALDGAGRPQTSGLSAESWSRIHFLESPVCDGCGVPFEFDIGARCAACLAEPRVFDRARAACLYDDASRELILKFKHGDRTDLAPLFCAWIGRSAPELVAQADAILPVPLHWTRLVRRRYNQAAEIARPLARRNGKLFLPDALTRTRATTSQGGKSGSGRQRNVSGVFAVPERKRGKVDGRRILLIDDVFTTGATAEACARALLKAGASAVDVAVIARVKAASNLSI